MVQTERKSFRFLGFTVLVELRDNPPEGFLEKTAGGCFDDPDDKGRFRVWFLGDLPPLKVISHECWHLYMTILGYMDTHEHTFEELNNEIYAYNFNILFENVLTLLFSMKRYQKAAMEDEEKREVD